MLHLLYKWQDLLPHFFSSQLKLISLDTAPSCFFRVSTNLFFLYLSMCISFSSFIKTEDKTIKILLAPSFLVWLCSISFLVLEDHYLRPSGNPCTSPPALPFQPSVAHSSHNHHLCPSNHCIHCLGFFMNSYPVCCIWCYWSLSATWNFAHLFSESFLSSALFPIAQLLCIRLLCRSSPPPKP